MFQQHFILQIIYHSPLCRKDRRRRIRFFGFRKNNNPTHVESIEDDVFIDHRVKLRRYPSIKTIYYKGTKEEWDNKFSNVILNNIKLICKK